MSILGQENLGQTNWFWQFDKSHNPALQYMVLVLNRLSISKQLKLKNDDDDWVFYIPVKII